MSVCEIVISLTGLADLFLTSKYSCAYSFLLDVVSGPENKITTFNISCKCKLNIKSMLCSLVHWDLQ